MPAQSAAQSVLEASRVEVGRIAVVHGQISYLDGRRQSVWLVVADVKRDGSAIQRPKRETVDELYGLVDSADGSVFWMNLEPPGGE